MVGRSRLAAAATAEVMMDGRRLSIRVVLGLFCAGVVSSAARAEVPFPSCVSAGCTDPADFASYLFIAPGALPNDYSASDGDAWKFAPDSGMDIVGAWERTTGRPDVKGAILDSGIRWQDNRDLGRKVWLNTGELPVPSGCASQDCDDNGFVSVDDFADACAADLNASGYCDGQDLIKFYSNGIDDDGNGFVDDIAGWDFLENDNDPDDDVEYGHGTGEAGDQYSEANNGFGFPGVSPNSFFLPLRVGDSFVADDQSFLQAVVYATDRGVDLISEALGTINSSANGQAAVTYAYRRGIPIIASAADEESRHHNSPANYDHMIWVNSVTQGDGLLLEEGDINGYEILNGCTNYGGKAWAAIPSSSCSSEATGRAGGLTALLMSHAKNQIDRGLFSPNPETGTPFSAEEVRQLFRASARDVDQSEAPFLQQTSTVSVLGLLLSAPALGLNFGSSHFPTGPEWDQFTGYGRPLAPTMFDLVTDTTIPPEADLTGSVRWYDIVDPVRTPSFDVRGSARAVRAGNSFDWTLEVGCGVQPLDYTLLGSGSSNGAAIDDEVLVSWAAGDTAALCGFDPTVPIEAADDHTVSLRLRVVDVLGNLGEDRRTVAIHSDATLHYAPLQLPGSGETSPALADVNRDGALDIIQAGGDGSVHVLDGATGSELPGFPTQTNPLPVHASPAFTSGDVPVPHEMVLGAAAADDLDGDGRVEIVISTGTGKLYVFDDHGVVRPGFPVAVDPNLSLPENRNRLNDQLRGFAAAPVLVDLDAPGASPALEIVVSALDSHLYAWHADGSAVAGFPVRLADRTKVSIDPATGQATPLPGVDARERAGKSLSSPAVGDLDGDGRPEIVVATNEEYGNELNGWAIESPVFRQLAALLASLDVDDLSVDTQGRVYAVKPDGNNAAGGPFLTGWPVAVPLLTPGVLPTVGTGTPGSPAITDIDGTGKVRIAIFGIIGPALLIAPDGSPSLGLATTPASQAGKRRVFAIDYAGGGFPNVPATTGSPDAPFFPAIGSGAFGDLDGDGLPEYVAPSGGLRKLLDIVAPAQQGQLPDPDSFVEDNVFAQHQITAWDPRTGAVLPAFPRLMDDMQFFGSPAIADVDGDGHAEVINGSGAYLVRAYRADGSTPAGFPKFTHGWHIGSPTPGDVDGDGLIELVATTREGKLFVWDTPAPATEAALQWAGFGRDRRNTKNTEAQVSNLAAAVDPLAGLGWALESIRGDIEALIPTLPEPDQTLLRGSFVRILISRALGFIGTSDEFKTSQSLGGIEASLAMTAHPIDALDPLHEQFLDAVRAALVREIAATHCAPGDVKCTNKVRFAQLALDFGDGFRATGSPNVAVNTWAKGIAKF
jgi:Subtilase family